MTNNFKSLYILIAIIFCFAIVSCKKEKGGILGAITKADFTIVQASNSNSVNLVNKTSTSSIPYWRINNAPTFITGDTAQTSFVFAGTYSVTLFVVSQGGIDSITKTVTITQSDPNACQGTQWGFISGCTSKLWKLDPTAGAYQVGPNPNDGSWWANTAGDVPARSCEFNDEYTFYFNANQTFTYDNKGDFYGDGYMGNNTSSCQPSSNYTPVQAPWGSGTFKYSFTPNAGINKLGQLTVLGLGAHIGLQKVRNGAEVTTGPATSITYDVLAETHNPAGYDLLTLGVNAGGYWWTFRLRSF